MLTRRAAASGTLWYYDLTKRMAAVAPLRERVEVAAPSSFGEMLRNCRLAAGLTQEELAERAGLSARAISDHERGIKQRPHPATVRMLADALGISPVERSLLTSTARKLGSSAGTLRQSQPHPSLPVGGFLGALPMGPLVAREAELARVVAALDSLERGPRALRLLAGEPGIGKTRLAQEIGLVLQEREFLVLIGRCYGTERDIPYYPFLEALGAAWAAMPDDMRTRISSHLPHLQRLLPDVGAPISGTSGTSPEERDRLKRAVAAFLQALAAQVPVALLLDDLHWADRSSLGLLQHLTRFTQGSRIFLLGTYRDVEVGPDHPLHAAIVDLRRDQLVEVVGLAPLSRTETRALIEAMLDDVHVSDASADLVHQRTDGNAFFVQAVLGELDGCIEQEGPVRRLVIDDLEVPNTVRALILQRLSSLSPAAQNLAFRASVLGQAFGFDDLLATGEDTEDKEEEGLEEAKRVGLIRVTGRDSYAFSHALTHQAVFDELPVGRRRRLHLAVGLALERLPERIRRRRAGEIARHLLEGGNMERALVYTLLAGDQAEEVFAQAEAERFYRRAVDLARELDDRARDAEALKKLGGVLRFPARYDEALELLEQAADLYRVLRDREGEGRAEAMIGMVHFCRGTSEEGIARLQPRLLSLEGQVSLQVLCALYEAQSQLFFGTNQYREHLESAERWVQAAKETGDEAILARARGRHGTALMVLGRVEDAIVAHEEAIVRAEAAGEMYALMFALNELAEAYEMSGALDKAMVLRERYLEVTKQMGYEEEVAFALCGLARTLLLLGDWHRAREQLDQAATIDRSQTSWYASSPPLVLAELCLLEGDDAARRYLAEGLGIAEQNRDLQGTRYGQRLLAELDLQQRRPEAALARLEPLLDRPGMEEIQVTWLLPVLTEAHVQLSDGPEALQRAADTVMRALERTTAQGDRVDLCELFRVQGVLLVRQGHCDQAERAFEQAISLAHSMPYPYAEARTLYEWGTMCAQNGEAKRARERLESALSIFRRLGACADVGRVEEALNALGPRGSSIQADARW